MAENGELGGCFRHPFHRTTWQTMSLSMATKGQKYISIEKHSPIMKSFPSSVTFPSVSPEDYIGLKHTLHPELWPCADPSRLRFQSYRHELFDDFNGHTTVAGARFNYFRRLAYSHTLHCRGEFPRCDLGDPSPDERSAAYTLLLHVVTGRRGMFNRPCARTPSHAGAS